MRTARNAAMHVKVAGGDSASSGNEHQAWHEPGTNWQIPLLSPEWRYSPVPSFIYASMSLIIRFFLIFFCGLLPAASCMADNGRKTAIAIERAVASCRGDQQCEAAVRKREISAAEKRQQREAADNALKESNPGGYYLTLLGRFLTAFAFIGGAAGLYVLAMHLLFGKRKRRPKSQTNRPQ